MNQKKTIKPIEMGGKFPYSGRWLGFWLEGIANQKSDLEILSIKSKDRKLNSSVKPKLD
jgi:hypothetical protein